MEVLKNNAYKLLDRDMVKKLIDNVKESAPAVVDELHEKMSIGDIQKVLRRLLRERVPVRDLISILETLADYQSQTKNTDVLTEYARASLSETITRQFRTEENELNVAVLDTALESHLISEAQKGNLNPNTLGFTPETVEKLYLGCSKVFQNMLNEGTDAVLMTSPVLRPTLYEFLVPILPEIHVLSYNDITMDTQIKTVDRISLN
jgi:flagellar biosynthesis protein FlhA